VLLLVSTLMLFRCLSAFRQTSAFLRHLRDTSPTTTFVLW